jgi:uncharacterized membrane protein YeaQ/YmgE (transglycosylase-associated protein family)
VSIILYLVIGVIAGWLASNLMKGGGMGLVGDLVLGIIGSFVGGFFFWMIGFRSTGMVGNLVTATVGAVLFIAILRVVKRA